MAAFLSTQVTITSTAVKIVTAADFDREVIVGTGGVTQFQIGFTSAEVDTGMVWNSDMSTSKGAAVLRFVLPADEELWAKHPTGGVNTLNVFVCRVS